MQSMERINRSKVAQCQSLPSTAVNTLYLKANRTLGTRGKCYYSLLNTFSLLSFKIACYRVVEGLRA